MQFLSFQLAGFSDGIAIPNGKCFVYQAGTSTLAPLYNVTGSPITNPAIASSLAQVGFAAADGTYDLQPAFPDGTPAGPKILGQQLLDFASIMQLLGFRPESYGAKADGITNDTSAFQQIATLVNAAGGGIVNLKPGATYLVGVQTLVNNGTFMFEGQDILTITGCPKAVIINANGATLKLAAGLKYGTFNADGTVHTHTMPFTDRTFYSAPLPDFAGIIGINNCTGPVEIRDLKIDGNLANLAIGGQYGDTGWQVAGDGLLMFDNTGGELVENVELVHCPRDGAMGWRSLANSTVKKPTVFRQVNSHGNGRQGFSLTDGRSYTFEECNFDDTGTTVNVGTGTALYSAPGAGVDIEANDLIRDVHFKNCQFNNNMGCAMVSDGTNAADVTFELCTFVGTAAWAAWINAPRFRFRECNFIGLINLPYQPTNPTDGPLFEDCLFSDDSSLSPTGVVFDRAGINSSGANPTYALCKRSHFDGGRIANMDMSTGAIFEDCVITCDPAHSAGPNNAILRGLTTINGSTVDYPFSFPGAVSSGRIIVNGADRLRGKLTAYDPASIANGGRDASQVISVSGARIGQHKPLVTCSTSLQGISTAASYVSSSDHVTLVLDNNTGAAVDLPSSDFTVTAIDLGAS